MTKELPGFYFDPAKNRYFPIKGPIPGSNKKQSLRGKTELNENKLDIKCTRWRQTRTKSTSLLHKREIDGKMLRQRKYKIKFQKEYQKLQASNPMVWSYNQASGEGNQGIVALEQFHLDFETQNGQKEIDVLLMGSTNGSLRLYEVGFAGQDFDDGENNIPNRVWPPCSENERICSLPKIRGLQRASSHFPSSISSIKKIGKMAIHGSDTEFLFHHALVTSLGSGASGGSVAVLNLNETGGFGALPVLHSCIYEIVTLPCTIWTSECSPNGMEAVIGTDVGAAMINLERGLVSWIFKSRNDVFSQQFNLSIWKVLPSVMSLRGCMGKRSSK